jgi:hypothetical protein
MPSLTKEDVNTLIQEWLDESCSNQYRFRDEQKQAKVRAMMLRGEVSSRYPETEEAARWIEGKLLQESSEQAWEELTAPSAVFGSPSIRKPKQGKSDPIKTGIKAYKLLNSRKSPFTKAAGLLGLFLGG